MNTLFTGPHAHHAGDRALLRELGLSIAPLPHAAETCLGEFKRHGARVKVFCAALPAKFWRFEIVRGGRKEAFETDSGALATHWPEALRRINGKAKR